MKLNKEQWKKILVDSGFLDKKQFDLALSVSEEQKADLYDVLIDKNILTDNHIGQLLAQEFNFPFIDLSKTAIDEKVLRDIPEVVAKSRNIIAFDRDENGVKIAMCDPDDLPIINLIKKKLDQEVTVYLATSRDIKNSLVLYHQGLSKDFSELIKEHIAKAKGAKAEDQPIVQIVDMMMTYAYENKASDIHIEPYDKKDMIRYRIDGILHDVAEYPKDLHASIVSRIKILSRMRTDEHLSAQDGKFQFETDGDKFDVRVSIVPIVRGEKIVMRLLSERARQFTLEELGFSDIDFKKITKAIDQPHGMILATGPTGSGKTTTLYSILKILNKREVNISTIEDPVEYDLEGVNQIQVNTKTNLTFAQGLRAIVRQDPDIIMVGEIRDRETADIAINSAMTGHLVLSTLHTNDAATTLPRLLDMDVEPFLVSSTVNLIIAQRLVRKICTSCMESQPYPISKVSSKIPEELHAKYLSKDKVRLYHGKGCKLCNNTGYRGRIGIFEVILMNSALKKMIMDRSDADEIKRKSKEMGMKTMLEDGLDKVFNGLTTIDEVYRVTREEN